MTGQPRLGIMNRRQTVTLGAREAGTIRPDEAVVAFGEALGDLTREHSQFH
jgi:hypothetical protein